MRAIEAIRAERVVAILRNVPETVRMVEALRSEIDADPVAAARDLVASVRDA